MEISSFLPLPFCDKRTFYGFALCLLLTLAGWPGHAQAPVHIGFDDPRWQVDAQVHRVEPFQGQSSVYLDGQMHLNDLDLGNAVIEVDVAPNPNRSFAGIMFRVQEGGQHEEVYIRLHKSGLPDAVQYNPVFNGFGGWQLYPEHQAADEFPTTRWIHLRLEVHGPHAALFIDGKKEPTLVVESLRTGATSGSVGLWGLLGNRFANFCYTLLPDGNPVATAAASEPVPGLITAWQLSPNFPAATVDPLQYPSLPQTTWETVDAEPSGLLNLAKYRGKTSAPGEEEMVWIRLPIRAARARQVLFTFDFSDETVLYLNGKLLFGGDNHFLAKGLLFRGDVALGSNYLALDLKRGQNELLVGVSEQGNGWGWIGQFVETDGLTWDVK
ncbi:hypothetical protein SAMN05421823_11338 [Catalinimonas alkaloidigena]|uniref:3-keto-alpha-glucoside-1,2-lyase/3-keto-2-hydroxy-glucal hydratase domain-containing protein n=1 Tax=Catalinimonas alkaloidigena TaxID=1075417 RepID=A0A1G9SYY5_9BACT|nr:hypothetical protein [Catalinimonas alkaloidigena]SDM40671.1 hypothetical protein SAMN05421823_11338 [Catalinimonas alkaloidigena]